MVYGGGSGHKRNTDRNDSICIVTAEIFSAQAAVFFDDTDHVYKRRPRTLVHSGAENTRWAIVLPYIISAYNLIITRSFFESLPEEMAEAVKIDGGSEWTVMTKIFFPLSKPIISVLILFYVVGYWNIYFAPLIFLSNEKLQPIQLYLRSILITSEVQASGMGLDAILMNEQMKYAVIVIACFPIMVLYPFIQKYFEKGVLIGAVK